MNTMKVVTGYGYFKDKDGNIISKYDLPIGEHPLRDNFTFTEVPDKQSLNSIIIYQPPKTLDERQREKISIEQFEVAKASLIAKGEWV